MNLLFEPGISSISLITDVKLVKNVTADSEQTNQFEDGFGNVTNSSNSDFEQYFTETYGFDWVVYVTNKLIIFKLSML